MILTTAADWRYGNFVSYSNAQAIKLGYPLIAYDLGGLGMGKEWDITDENFDAFGYYAVLEERFRSTARHKPAIIQKTLLDYQDFVTYLDGDAIVVANIDEIIGDYDVGITIRRANELNEEVPAMLRRYRGWINAGVLFFNYTPNALRFIELWQQAMHTWQDDQWALNEMLCPHLQKPAESFLYQDVKVKCFSGEIYNYCYLPEQPSDQVKIMHYRNRTWKSLFSS